MKNALICFLKYPEPGHVKTRLAVDISPELAAELYTFLAERIITEVFTIEQRYDILLYVDPSHPISRFQEWLGDQWTYKTQSGGDLGHRMDMAITDCFKAGYDRVMIIGSDCVGMDETFIGEAFDALDSHDLVLGPAGDGGYYLLAMSEQQSWLFKDMPWSTDQVLPATLDRIEARELKVHQLEEKLDVDTADDLDRFRKSLPEEHFLARKIDQIVLDAISRVGSDGENLDLLSPDHYRTQVIDNVVIEDGDTDQAPEAAATATVPPSHSDGHMSMQNLFRPVFPNDKKSGR